VKFFKACKKADIKQILGVEAYFVDDRLSQERKSRHIILLAENNTGLDNLYKMMTEANRPTKYGGGFYYRARIDWDLLRKYNEGIICMTACIGGIIPKIMIEEGYYEARKATKKLLEIFGKDRLFLEIQDVNEDDVQYIPEQELVKDMSRKLAKDLGLRCVATNDIHYLDRKDAFAHEVFKAISSSSTLDTPIRGPEGGRGRIVFQGYDYYVKPYEEMLKKFEKEEVAISAEIAERCNVDIPLKQNHMPHFDPSLSTEEVYEKLVKQCRKGWKKLGINSRPNVDDYTNRVKRELADIKDACLQDYFMIVWDVMRFVQTHKIGRGYSRGSAGGSLVSYLLDITKVDPIRYGLKWERFWNKGRAGSMPDIDLDIAIDRRDEVISYLRQKFGGDRVYPMVTLSKLTAKAALKDAGKVVGLDFEYMNAVSKEFPDKCKSIKDAIERSKYIKRLHDEHVDKDIIEWRKEIKEERAKDDTNIGHIEDIYGNIKERQKRIQDMFKAAFRFEDCCRQRSSHACALLIADKDIAGKIPLCYDPAHGKMLTGFDMYDLEEMGYLKLDILGLKTVSVLDRISPTWMDEVGDSFDDPFVFRLLTTGHNKGLFQVEKALGKDWSQKIKPTELEDIAALVSIIRPAVLEAGLADQYVENKDSGKIAYIHPELRPILASTHGVMLYQEQMIDIASHFARLTPEEADNLRKAVGKKKEEVIAEVKPQFIEGVTKHYNEQLAADLWEWLAHGAEYGFNKSHAVGYGMLTYATTYFKVYKPHKFFCAMLQFSGNEQKPQEEIAELFMDAKLFGIDVKPPAFDRGNYDFEIDEEEEAIYFGLKHIKHVGASSIKALSSLDLKSWDDTLVNRKGIKKDVMQALVLCGAFDALGKPRRTMRLELDFLRGLRDIEAELFWGWYTNGSDYVKHLKKGEKRVVFHKTKNFTESVRALLEFVERDNPGLKIVNSRRVSTVKQLCQEYLDSEPTREMSIVEKAGYEIYYLGVPATCSKVDVYDDDRRTHTCIQIQKELAKTDCVSIGMIDKVIQKTDRKGNPYAIISLSDGTYAIESFLFYRAFAKFNKLLEAGKIVLFKGAKGQRGSFIIENIEEL
jgi:DNA polymerase-3 subunit alpha